MAANQPHNTLVAAALVPVQNPPLIAAAPVAVQNPPQMTRTIEEIVAANKGQLIPIIEGIIEASGGLTRLCEDRFELSSSIPGITFSEVMHQIDRWEDMKYIKRKYKFFKRKLEFAKIRNAEAEAQAQAQAQAQVTGAPDPVTGAPAHLV